MKLHQTLFLIGESFRTLGRHKGIMSLSVIIMSLTLLVLAGFGVVFMIVKMGDPNADAAATTAAP